MFSAIPKKPPSIPSEPTTTAKVNNWEITAAMKDLDEIHEKLKKLYCSEIDAISAFREEAIKFTEKHQLIIGAVIFNDFPFSKEDIYEISDIHIDIPSPFFRGINNDYGKDPLSTRNNELLVYMTPKEDEIVGRGSYISSNCIDHIQSCTRPNGYYIQLLHAGRDHDEEKFIELEMKKSIKNEGIKLFPYAEVDSIPTFEKVGSSANNKSCHKDLGKIFEQMKETSPWKKYYGEWLAKELDKSETR